MKSEPNSISKLPFAGWGEDLLGIDRAVATDTDMVGINDIRVFHRLDKVLPYTAIR